MFSFGTEKKPHVLAFFTVVGVLDEPFSFIYPKRPEMIYYPHTVSTCINEVAVQTGRLKLNVIRDPSRRPRVPVIVLIEIPQRSPPS